jgi:hypothetical protein
MQAFEITGATPASRQAEVLLRFEGNRRAEFEYSKKTRLFRMNVAGAPFNAEVGVAPKAGWQPAIPGGEYLFKNCLASPLNMSFSLL